MCECEREMGRERERERDAEVLNICFLVVFYNRCLDLSLGLRMKSTAVKEVHECFHI